MAEPFVRPANANGFGPAVSAATPNVALDVIPEPLVAATVLEPEAVEAADQLYDRVKGGEVIDAPSPPKTFGKATLAMPDCGSPVVALTVNEPELPPDGL